MEELLHILYILFFLSHLQNVQKLEIKSLLLQRTQLKHFVSQMKKKQNKTKSQGSCKEVLLCRTFSGCVEWGTQIKMTI